jgi:hypothetical protein
MSITSWSATATPRLPNAAFSKTSIVASIAALAISILSALPGNASAQTIETCKTPESQARRKNVKLEKLTSLEDLLRQMRDGMKNDILCLEPEELQLGWGISLWGDWRWHRQVEPIHYVWPTHDVLRAMIAANPMEKYEILYDEFTREHYPGTAQPEIRLSIGRLSTTPEVVGEGDLVSLQQLKELFGEFTEFSTRHPIPSDRNPPKQSGPYPYYDAIWEKSNPNYRVHAFTAANSTVSSISITIK